MANFAWLYLEEGNLQSTMTAKKCHGSSHANPNFPRANQSTKYRPCSHWLYCHIWIKLHNNDIYGKGLGQSHFMFYFCWFKLYEFPKVRPHPGLCCPVWIQGECLIFGQFDMPWFAKAHETPALFEGQRWGCTEGRREEGLRGEQVGETIFGM